MSDLANDFLVIVSNQFGTVSKRFSRQYFDRQGKVAIWDSVLEQTQFMDESYNMSHRIFALQNNYTKFELCPTCGQGHSRFVGKSLADISYSEFCSTKCMLTSDSRSEKLKAGMAKIDKDAANEKRKATMKEKYGVEFNSQREDKKDIWTRSKIQNPEVVKTLADPEWLYEQYVELQKPSTTIADDLGVYYGTVIDRLKEYGIDIRYYQNRSYLERTIFDFVKEIAPDAIHSDREVLDGFELDIVVPSKNVAFEVNGLFWHSFDRHTTKEEQNKHLSKTLNAKDKGYSLVQILESEWLEKPEIIKSIIRNRLGASETFYARKCAIVEVSREKEKKFLEENHIQGFVASKICIGLEHNGELVQIMSFGQPRFNKNYQWELLRSCAKLNTSIVGGASKLLSKFLESNSGSVICYSDRRFGEGEVYSRIGFSFKESLPPSYSYTNRKKVFSRYKFQKHKLKEQLSNFDPELSEEQNMFNNGYRKLWDCGMNVYVLDTKKEPM